MDTKLHLLESDRVIFAVSGVEVVLEGGLRLLAQLIT